MCKYNFINKVILGNLTEMWFNSTILSCYIKFWNTDSRFYYYIVAKQIVIITSF